MAGVDLDKTDPGWRFEEIQAKRLAVKINENGADLVNEVHAALPKEWWKPIKGISQEEDLAVILRRDPGITARLRALLMRLQPTVAKARSLATVDQARFAVQDEVNPLDTRVEHLQRTQYVAILLDAVATQDILDNDFEAGLGAIRGIVNLGWYLKEEPYSMSGTVRVAVYAIALNRLEDLFRFQVKNNPPETALSSLQTLLLEEGADIGILHWIRCERAMGNQIFERLTNKKLTIEQSLPKGQKVAQDKFREWQKNLGKHHAYYLQKMNEAVEIAKRPLHEQAKEYAKWTEQVRKPDAKQEGGLAALLFPEVAKPHKAFVGRCAELRVVGVGLAVERFRRATGQWPTDLSKTVPKYLPNIPTDPFDGQPLRYRVFPEGVAVYSLGERLREAVRVFNDVGRDEGSIIFFRLWNPENRGRPM
jgi:hypothetical protein